MELAEAKAALRQQMYAARDSIDPVARAEAQELLNKRLWGLPAVRNASNVGTYHAVGSEISPLPTVRALREGKKARSISYPVVIGKTLMAFFRMSDEEAADLLVNPKTVSSYSSEMLVRDEELDLVLVPGVAFDGRCNRLGQGGGFYDRYLAHVGSDCLTIGIAFDQQIVDAVPTGRNDLRVDYVVTPTRTLAR